MLKKILLVVSAIFGVSSFSSGAFAGENASDTDSLKTELSARDEAVNNVSDETVLYFSDAISEVSGWRSSHWSHRSHASHASHRSGYRY